MAHGPSVPRWLAGGSRAVSTPAFVRPGLPSTASAQPPTRASASNVQASEPRASARRPSPSAGTRVPSPGCPASPATGRFHYQPGPRAGRAPSTAPPGPPEADPDPGPRLCHRGLRALAHKWNGCMDRGDDGCSDRVCSRGLLCHGRLNFLRYGCHPRRAVERCGKRCSAARSLTRPGGKKG